MRQSPTDQPLPDEGIAHRRLTLIFNVVIASLSIALVVFLARIRWRHRRMAGQGISSRSGLWARIAVAVVLNLTLPIVLLFLWLAVPAWRALILFEPHLGCWLSGVAIVLFIKGVLELAFIARVYRQTQDAKFLTRPSHIGTRIVVVGGGVGGLAAARHLDRLLGGRSGVAPSPPNGLGASATRGWAYPRSTGEQANGSRSTSRTRSPRQPESWFAVPIPRMLGRAFVSFRCPTRLPAVSRSA